MTTILKKRSPMGWKTFPGFWSLFYLNPRPSRKHRKACGSSPERRSEFSLETPPWQRKTLLGLQHSYFPRQWRKATVILIPKPGKESQIRRKLKASQSTTPRIEGLWVHIKTIISGTMISYLRAVWFPGGSFLVPSTD